ncbi:hypothetical protein KDJ56_00530 [Brevibacillus composti]|uniref:Uncharacterized protein n=1 Tax=Brevibacillus composti TaxID=2796470 RepID=A0A7T5EKZ6_9BACL|nr:hypothetical protein [Brevibacillus composti]QQE74531.1 hypothetical protein JD108_00530 [Brevibacillus composti]QUO41613.1 hypothetical protein KDJ56_00530 [Brevibacillus composti]
MNTQTIYSYKLVRRFRWRLAGLFLQLLLFLLFFLISVRWLATPLSSLIVSLAVLPGISVLHLCLFRIYTSLRGHSPQTTPDMLFSPWWGAGYRFPVPLASFRGAETTVLAGTLFLAAALYVWLPAPYGLTLLAGAMIAALPRAIAILISLRVPKQCRVKYERRSVAFLLTDG